MKALALVGLFFVATCAAAEPKAVDLSQLLDDIPDSGTYLKLTPAEEAFDVRCQEADIDGGPAAAFAYAEHSYLRNPTPHIRAVFAEFLFFGSAFGAPEGRRSEAIQIAAEALKQGAVRAYGVLGLELMQGDLVASDPLKAYDYATRGVAGGDPLSMALMGSIALADGSRDRATQHYIQAAINGFPSGLCGVAELYEKKTFLGEPNMGKACNLYFVSARYGCAAGLARLRQLADSGTPGAIAYVRRLDLIGAEGTQNRRLLSAARFLEKNCADDPEALSDLGYFYFPHPRYRFSDAAKARTCLEKGAKLGSLDARALLAVMWAEGMGGPKEPAKALAELRKLGLVGNNANALAELGYLSYWGTLEDVGWPKDARMAFNLSLRSATAGSFVGARNLSECYGDGVGVEKDYGLAAKYAWRAYIGGAFSFGDGRRLVDDYLAFVKE